MDQFLIFGSHHRIGRRVSDCGLLDVGEERGEAVKIMLRERIKFMVMAFGATDR